MEGYGMVQRGIVAAGRYWCGTLPMGRYGVVL